MKDYVSFKSKVVDRLGEISREWCEKYGTGLSDHATQGQKQRNGRLLGWNEGIGFYVVDGKAVRLDKMKIADMARIANNLECLENVVRENGRKCKWTLEETCGKLKKMLNIGE